MDVRWWIVMITAEDGTKYLFGPWRDVSRADTFAVTYDGDVMPLRHPSNTIIERER